MKVLIVDDVEADRKMLRQTISRNHKGCEFIEAKDIDEMYSGLSHSPHILFQDVSLVDTDGHDSQGMTAMFDVIDSHPEIPIVIITGYYLEKIREFTSEFLGKTTQIIDFLDKMNYNEGDIKRIFVKAKDYKETIVKDIKNKLSAEELLNEILENEKQRVNEQLKKVGGDIEKASEADRLYKEAFSGDDWISRIKAEFEITGSSNTNAVLICIQIEKLIKEKYLPQDNKKKITFYDKLDWLCKQYRFTENERNQINNAWQYRNMIIHSSKKANKDIGLKLARCLDTIKRIL